MNYLVLLIAIGWSVYKRLSPVENLGHLTEVQLRAKTENKLENVREAHEFRSGHIPGAVNIP
ncbi:hypothetical protein ACH95_10695 [Bacillus glycinifermentans]|uniref:Rhodanese-like domain-containing protein n=1 Tax=Bacillus glycinifermentans TaxID=1664069 RepID=A0A0J6EWB9_9BACI|nr:rhodanese-like domain-containing protein [Bacillus glycinifermentans]ATH92515.1 rhodanese-like domain-containing protein [Bacillus glycinifermentans]KMM59965.1 hypothetical protein ACH95_10695 [Bacillus glycinifermentans]KRT95260.1 hypothetical protein AB447_212195 [Bacillus glycinifermentans]MEC0485062.1 rhodanese-like domain-containing protein [Bacillus glycinifermentans]MEC0493273.1 rhodanese-like domain-containing protein [Bacillus glycinifermentans]